MNEDLIVQWNKVVSVNDVVVIAGDSVWNARNYDDARNRFFRHLNGSIILIKGNHDHWLKSAQEKRYEYHKTINGQPISVTHYPGRSWWGMGRGGWNLHGHSHSILEPWHNQLDVGVDNAAKLLGKYRPFSFNAVKYFIEKIKR